LESIYSEPEVEYLKSQHLAGIATATRQGKPDVSPVSFEFDDTHFFVGSHSQNIFLSTRKYKNVRDGNKEVALYRPVSACFRLPFCLPQSALQSVLAGACCPLLVPDSLLSTHQYLRLRCGRSGGMRSGGIGNYEISV
jgi:Pyridoxamine 5'-phosphate oxidase